MINKLELGPQIMAVTSSFLATFPLLLLNARGILQITTVASITSSESARAGDVIVSPTTATHTHGKRGGKGGDRLVSMC